MNFLSHYVFNHDVSGLPADGYFALGVALPDLWPRFSRRRRLKWKHVRAHQPRDERSARLRAGLLNHADVDRRFHTLPCFLAWQRELKTCVNGEGLHSMFVDFLTHVIVELVLDQKLLHAQPRLADQFYDTLANTDPSTAARHAATIGDVNTDGLDETLRLFQERRYMRRYATDDGLLHAIALTIGLANPAPPPSDKLVRTMLTRAVALVDPPTVWSELVQM
ncbi:MAG: hypothetical protein JXO22_11200 [Phycisphaerae bacterium]|nr:hypothetical protein [Phycisphaerae bacterium]